MSAYMRIDEQTIRDLSIIDHSGKASIFDIYNKTTTLGGSNKLMDMFRHPMSDEKLINERAEVIRFFSNASCVFPFDSETVGIVDYYLANDDVRSQLQQTDQSLVHRLKDLIVTDANDEFIRNGVQASLQLFYQLDQFLRSLEPAIAGTAFESSFTRLRDLIGS